MAKRKRRRFTAEFKAEIIEFQRKKLVVTLRNFGPN